MRIFAIIAALFLLSGCESMEFVAVDYHHGYNHGPYVRPVGHMSYTLGYYSGNYYNGWAVYGSLGHRYYYAPQYYSHHRTFVRPVVVQHVHVHASYCEHNYRPRNPRNDHRERDNHRSSFVQPQVRNTPARTTPPRTRQQVVPNQSRNNTRNDNRRREAVPSQRRQPARVVPQRQRQPQATPPQNNRRVEREDRRGRDRDRNKKRK